jgi:hypothetical protein
MTDQVNWAAVELDYRAGIKSQREIAQYGISHIAIQKPSSRPGSRGEFQLF